MRWAFAVAVGLLVAGDPRVSAQDWAAVFPDRSHEFGTVARGSKIRHSFLVVNNTSQALHIDRAEPKCGCTDVKLGAREVPPGTQTTIEAVIDTTQFVGSKPSGFRLYLDRPVAQVLDYNTSCFIQPEVTLSPGSVDLGVVSRSAGGKAVLTLSYNGTRPDWAIMSAWTKSDQISARLEETGRSPSGAVAYQLTATLSPGAPVGVFKDEISLKTNDPATPNIPVSVAATIQGALTASPSVLNLGTVRAGEAVQRTVVIRSNQSVAITEIKSTRPELEARFAANEARPLHSLAVVFKAPATAGPFNASLSVQSDLKDEPPTRVLVFATVAP